MLENIKKRFAEKLENTKKWFAEKLENTQKLFITGRDWELTTGHNIPEMRDNIVTSSDSIIGLTASRFFADFLVKQLNKHGIEANREENGNPVGGHYVDVGVIAKAKDVKEKFSEVRQVCGGDFKTPLVNLCKRSVGAVAIGIGAINSASTAKGIES